MADIYFKSFHILSRKTFWCILASTQNLIALLLRKVWFHIVTLFTCVCVCIINFLHQGKKGRHAPNVSGDKYLPLPNLNWLGITCYVDGGRQVGSVFFLTLSFSFWWWFWLCELWNVCDLCIFGDKLILDMFTNMFCSFN